MNLVSKFSSRFSSWAYLLYAGAASFLAAFKGFVYAHLLSELQYAQVNYYLLVLGLGVLATGAGVIVRCHAELPLIVGDESPLAEFVGKVRSVGFLFWLLITVVVLGYALIKTLPVGILLLALVQVLVFFLFTVDLLVIKSRKLFVEYSRRLFVRNALIAAAGLAAAFATQDAGVAVFAEVAISIALYGKQIMGFLSSRTLVDRTFFRACLAFVPVTLLAALMQYVDRVLAAYLMPASEFSAFSYMSLVVMVALSIQQLINTRVITLLPEICQRDPKAGFRYVTKVAMALTALLCPALIIALWLLQSRFFAAQWLSVSIEGSALFVVCSLLRAADFYSSYLIVLGRKKALLGVQLFGLGVFLILGVTYYLNSAAPGLEYFMLLMSAGFLMAFLVLVTVSWRASRA